MGKRKKKPLDPRPPLSDPPPDLDKIVLHDAWLCSKVFLCSTAIDLVFKVFYVPFADPPILVTKIIELILHTAMIFFLFAALLNAALSSYFHFYRRIKTRT